MDISAVIPTYDRPADLTECLQSLQGQFVPLDELIIVDDGNMKLTAQAIEEAGIDNVTHVEGPGEGLPASRNSGVEVASGDIVCFVDDDTILPPNWSQELIDTYKTYGGVTGVGGLVVNYSPAEISKGNMNSIGYRVLTSVRLTFFYQKIGRISPIGLLYLPHIFTTAKERRVNALQGCNMSFRREIFDEYAFDEWYGSTGSSTCEELDFCARITDDGNELLYNSRAVALHKRSVTGEQRGIQPNYDNITNLTYFLLENFEKNHLNLFALTAAVLVFAALKRDKNYIVGVARGVKEHKKMKGQRS